MGVARRSGRANQTLWLVCVADAVPPRCLGIVKAAVGTCDKGVRVIGRFSECDAYADGELS